MTEKALTKIKGGLKSKMDRYGEVMKSAVADALMEFVLQNEEFAQAVVQGGSFEDCMVAVAKEVHGGAISDMNAFGAAVRFYFPGAEIKVKMTIDLVGAADPQQEEAATAPAEDSGAVIIDLSDFF